MRSTFGAFALAAALVFAGGIASAPATAAPLNGAKPAKGIETQPVVSDTDISSHRRGYRRYRYVRPWRHVHPYSYGYYRPRPYFYRPYSYAYYPPPYFYRPYYRPAPVFSIGVGFGPRLYW